MSPQRTFEAFIEQVWNAHRPDRIGEFVHPQVRMHAARGPIRDFAGYQAMTKDFQGAFSDLHFALEHVGEAGDMVFARLLITGTNDGPFRGKAPTGKRVRAIGQPLCRVVDGKIVEFWQLFDELGMLFQLGHVADASIVGAPAPA